MCSALGGRAAEEIMFGKISTGALSDLEKVTKQAYAMVSIYGLSEKIGNISYYDPQGNSMFQKPYSEDRATAIDKEVSRIIEEQYERAKRILTENKDKLILLAEELLQNEVIFKDNLVKIFGERIWDQNKEKIKEQSIQDNGNSESVEEPKLEESSDLTTLSTEEPTDNPETGESTGEPDNSDENKEENGE